MNPNISTWNKHFLLYIFPIYVRCWLFWDTNLIWSLNCVKFLLKTYLQKCICYLELTLCAQISWIFLESEIVILMKTCTKCTVDINTSYVKDGRNIIFGHLDRKRHLKIWVWILHDSHKTAHNRNTNYIYKYTYKCVANMKYKYKFLKIIHYLASSWNNIFFFFKIKWVKNPY